LASISSSRLASALLADCLAGRPCRLDLLFELTALAAGADPAASAAATRALFVNLVEPLCDRFEPSLCEVYASLFAEVIARCLPEFKAPELVARYRRIRRLRRCRADALRVYVLSRVTLGADVAITSVLLDAAKKRFPAAEICLVGPAKNWELFAADPRLRHAPLAYRRDASLLERLSAYCELAPALTRPGGIVIDPDSRITQLGLLPVCPEEAYYFFESRSYGGDGPEPLSVLAARWASEVFGVDDASPYVAPQPPAASGPAGISLSLGVGENPAKRLPDPFEPELVRLLLATGLPLLIDEGAGGEETDRVRRAIHGSGARPGQIETWRGAFAPFAARLARSRLYVGYDSAGQHVAAATSTPLVAIFAGFACQRGFQRWRPAGAAAVEVIRADRPDPAAVLERVRAALGRLLAR